MVLHWSLDPFTKVYQSLESGSPDLALIELLSEDFRSLTRVPKKNQASRQSLEKGTVRFEDGEYELNQEFKATAATLSDELDIDELIAAEILQNSSGLGITLLDNAKAVYYLRKQTILASASYIFNSGSQDTLNRIWDSSYPDSVLNAFKFVQEELDSIHQAVQRSRMLGQLNSSDIQLKLSYRREFLKSQHETLGEIFYGIVSKDLLTKDQFLKYLEFLSTFDVDDFFIVHIFPGLLLYASKLKSHNDQDVKLLHSELLKELKKSNIYQTPAKLFVIFAFCSYFIEWCKSSPDRLREFDFEIAIETPMTNAVQLGAIEQLLIITAETSDHKSESFYDIRSLLEQHLPRLVPKRVLDVNEEETKKARSLDPQSTTTVYIVNKEHKLSENMTQLLTDELHKFVQSFITDAAFLLVKMKDSEEDLLLSGEDLGLDDISKNADLERFYISVFYLYANRPSLISTFWEDRESNAFGFIEWVSKGEELLMRSSFTLMLSALASGAENSNHVYHFVANSDKVSWSTIIQILNAYVEKITEFEKSGDDRDLSEETVLLLASYLSLIYEVAINSEDVKESFDETLLETLFQFINLDTPLVGAALHVIRSLVSDDEARRNYIWEHLDSWLFSYQPASLKEAFQARLVSFPDILGFINLVETLLRPGDILTQKYQLPYPTQLGYPYRKPGISPYLEFILSDIFYHSPSLYFEEKTALQEPILQIINHSLSSFDPNLILNSFPAGVDLNTVVSTNDFTSYVQANAAPVVLSLLFQEKIYRTLLDIVSTGYDSISDKSFEEKQVQVVDLSLLIVSKILDLEVAFIDELLPIIKKENNFYLPITLGTHGLRSFYDAILFNLPVVAHIALYVGTTHLPIADKSIKLLSRFSRSPQFGANVTGTASGKTRLLSILDSVDESLRIKHHFMDQLESEISSEENFQLKVEILNFLNSNLSFSVKSITVSHFILGYDLKNGLSLGDSQKDMYIASKMSVLRTLLYILESSLLSINSQNVDYAPIRLTALSLEIILKLSRNPLSSATTLPFLNNFGLLDKLLETPRVDLNTNWSNEKMDSNFNEITSFNSGPGIGALLSLLNQRSFVLQYLSLELHRTASEGHISKTAKYIDALISGGDRFLGPPKVLSFLDVLEFSLSSIPTIPYELDFFQDVDLNLDLSKITLSDSSTGSIFNLESLDSMLNLHIKKLWLEGRYRTHKEEKAQLSEIEDVKNDLRKSETTKSASSSLIKFPTVIQSNEDEVLSERDLIKARFTNYLSTLKFKSYQLASLHSWVQVIQVIVTDGKLDPIKRSNFILEVFQSIVPRIDDYVERDILYAEELVSLCVSLYDIYHQDRRAIEQESPDISDGYERLYTLFKSCINGILSPSSSFSLRSDLYVLSNKYLSWILKHKDISREVLQSIKLSSDRLITIICNDAIGGEGPTRITGLLLLESLYQLSNVNQLNFVLNTLVKNNLLLLLVKSIKRTDDTLSLSHDNKITLDSLLYELTAFKATLSFLIRVAETRQGAQQLLQSEIFQTIKACSFLLIDPDLGLDLIFDETTVQTSTFVRVNLNLDTPLSFDNTSKGVSLFELLVPTFQLVSAILLSTSSENKQVIKQVKNLLQHFKKLVIGVLKRDVLVESKRENGLYKEDGINGSGLKDLVNLFVLLSTLTGYSGEE